jgi:prolyl oligopeptidase
MRATPALHRCLGAGAFVLFLALGACSNKEPSPPVAEIKPVTNTYHGVEVVDNYQWLENANDPAVKEWTEAENAYAREVLDSMACRDQIAGQLLTLYEHASPSYYSFQHAGNRLFAIKKQPPLDQPLLIVLDSPYEPVKEKVLVDPNQIDTTGKTSIDFYVVSPDARLVAVSLSQGGTEDGNVRVFRVEDGSALTDSVPRVNGPTAGGDVAWLSDGSGFFYTHYPREGERPEEDMRFYQQVFFHELGTPTEADTYVIGEEFPRIAEVAFETTQNSRFILAAVANGDGGEYGHWLRAPSGEWTQVTHFEDMISRAKFGPDDALYLFSKQNAPHGQILRLAPGKTSLTDAKLVIAESERVITDFLPTTSYVYVADMLGGPSQLRVFDLSGKFLHEVGIPQVASVNGLTSLGGDKVLYRVSTYLEPTVAYTYEPTEDQPVRTALAETSSADFSNVEVLRVTATSKDGTEVPMTILQPKGTQLDGNNPMVLYGYGGYGSSQRPWFNESLSLWLNRGGLYAIANIRGGGEFGEEWHQQGYLTNKQNVFDDFAACAKYLIDEGYTNSNRLAIRGGSNGGLLVGATMTQHPDLFKAVVCQKGVLDMLRVELDPNGAFNVTEFGTVTNPEQFRALYAYSPYHNIKDGVKYPDVLFTADENDGRVNPANSKKMVARLQAASPPGTLVLLRMSTGAGHGIGSSMSDRISQDADVWAFLFDRLGVECQQVTASPR